MTFSFNTSYTLGSFSSLFYVCTKLLLKTKHFPSFRPQNSKKSVEVGLVWFSQVKSTFSSGFAAARDDAGHTGTELMFSLKIY